VGFVVYDGDRFDRKILGSGWVQLVYSNDKYLVLKVKSNHPYANVLEIG
jgi:superoxide dismutase